MTPEAQKAARKQAYEKMKAARDNDPNYQARKQKYKEMQRARYKELAESIKAKKRAARLAQLMAKEEELAETFGLGEHLRLLRFE